MKKTIRLTESDLMRLVKRVINEQEKHGMGALFPEQGMGNYVFDLLNDKKNYIGEFKIVQLLSKKDSNVTIRVVNSSKNIKGIKNLKLDIKFDCLNKNGGFKVVDIDAEFLHTGLIGQKSLDKRLPDEHGQYHLKLKLNMVVYSPLLENKLKESVCMRTKVPNKNLSKFYIGKIVTFYADNENKKFLKKGRIINVGSQQNGRITLEVDFTKPSNSPSALGAVMPLIIEFNCNSSDHSFKGIDGKMETGYSQQLSKKLKMDFCMTNKSGV